MPKQITTCAQCGATIAYYPSRGRPPKRYCSRACKDQAAAGSPVKPRVAWTCPLCGRVLMLTEVKARRRRYCSWACQYAGRSKSVDEYRVNEQTGCWEWARFRDAKGYARISVNGRKTLAHRAYYERLRGPIPCGMELDHLCHNPSCVNPDHLEPVPGLLNNRRQRSVKLTDELVAEIRSLAPGMTQSAIAHRFNLDPSTVSRIVRGESWVRPTPNRAEKRGQAGLIADNSDEFP